MQTIPIPLSYNNINKEDSKINPNLNSVNSTSKQIKNELNPSSMSKVSSLKSHSTSRSITQAINKLNLRNSELSKQDDNVNSANYSNDKASMNNINNNNVNNNLMKIKLEQPFTTAYYINLFNSWKPKVEQFKLLMQIKHDNNGFTWCDSTFLMHQNAQNLNKLDFIRYGKTVRLKSNKNQHLITATACKNKLNEKKNLITTLLQQNNLTLIKSSRKMRFSTQSNPNNITAQAKIK